MHQMRRQEVELSDLILLVALRCPAGVFVGQVRRLEHVARHHTALKHFTISLGQLVTLADHTQTALRSNY